MTEQIKWSNAPDCTSWGASMRVADIALDRDHTLTLYCEADQTAKVNALFAEVERLRAQVAEFHEMWKVNSDGFAKAEAKIERLRALLTRYRNETPLGHQPHMIAHEVDAALKEGQR